MAMADDDSEGSARPATTADEATPVTAGAPGTPEDRTMPPPTLFVLLLLLVTMEITGGGAEAAAAASAAGCSGSSSRSTPWSGNAAAAGVERIIGEMALAVWAAVEPGVANSRGC